MLKIYGRINYEFLPATQECSATVKMMVSDRGKFCGYEGGLMNTRDKESKYIIVDCEHIYEKTWSATILAANNALVNMAAKLSAAAKNNMRMIEDTPNVLEMEFTV